MTRSKKAIYNTLSNILLQLVLLVCRFILPRLILSRFGSSYNGITTSVSQFMSVIALLRSGIGGATRAALYKPLADKDGDQISSVMLATEKFMHKISMIFALFILVFSCAYPLMVQEEFSWGFSASLVLIISLSTFMQHYFGLTYQLLLEADQRKYVHTLIEIAAAILNVAVAALLINLDCSIHVVKLGSALVFSMSPVFLHFYVRKNYKLRRDVKPDFTSIRQRWDAFFHQVAFFVHNNTDITLLTIFTNTLEISVYSVHYLVGNGLRRIVSTISSGIGAAFGNMLAKNEKETLHRSLDMYELLVHLMVCVLFGAALVLITPFVAVYTRGVTDVSYYRPTFAYLVVLAEMLYCLRSPYQVLIEAAGHFKQTKKHAFVETALNLGVSLCLVGRYGLVGVVLGTLISILYLNIAYAVYASGKLLERSVLPFIKRFAVTGLSIAVIVALSLKVPAGEITGYLQWVIHAVKVALISLAVTLGMNLLFYGRLMKALMRKLLTTFRSLASRN